MKFAFAITVLALCSLSFAETPSAANANNQRETAARGGTKERRASRAQQPISARRLRFHLHLRCRQYLPELLRNREWQRHRVREPVVGVENRDRQLQGFLEPSSTFAGQQPIFSPGN